MLVNGLVCHLDPETQKREGVSGATPENNKLPQRIDTMNMCPRENYSLVPGTVSERPSLLGVSVW